jgi:hypothetical protein
MSFPTVSYLTANTSLLTEPPISRDSNICFCFTILSLAQPQVNSPIQLTPKKCSASESTQ